MLNLYRSVSSSDWMIGSPSGSGRAAEAGVLMAMGNLRWQQRLVHGHRARRAERAELGGGLDARGQAVPLATRVGSLGEVIESSGGQQVQLAQVAGAGQRFCLVDQTRADAVSAQGRIDCQRT